MACTASVLAVLEQNINVSANKLRIYCSIHDEWTSIKSLRCSMCVGQLKEGLTNMAG
jgi:hypothetical protein